MGFDYQLHRGEVASWDLVRWIDGPQELQKTLPLRRQPAMLCDATCGVDACYVGGAIFAVAHSVILRRVASGV
jgi:hypothetical protein